MIYLLLSLVLLALTGLAIFTFLVGRRVEMGVPAEGRFITIMGSRIHYVEQGSGERTLLLIHGLGGAAANFSYAMLGDLARDYRVVAIDRPGSGYSRRARRASSGLVTQADVVAGVIDALQLGKPVLVGHSLGGAVALATALRHPEKVQGLALIAPLTHMPVGGTPDVFATFNIRPTWLRTLFAWTLLVPLSIRRRKQVLEVVFGPEPAPADYPIRGGGVLGLRPSHFDATSRDAQMLEQVLPGMQARYTDLQVPVRILYGRDDRILDAQEQGQGLVDVLPTAELEWVDGGHMLPVTQAGLSADFVRRTLELIEERA